MPAVQVDLGLAATGGRALWLLFAALAALAWGGGPALLALVLALAAILANRARCRFPAGALYFDGCNWWLSRTGQPDEKLILSRAGYVGPGLVSLRLRGASREWPLPFWRWQLDRETWRRLRLAARYGVNTVSTASAADSG